MKKHFKFLAVVFLFVTIGILTVSCGGGGDGGSGGNQDDYTEIIGNWNFFGCTLNISGSTGTIPQFPAYGGGDYGNSNRAGYLKDGEVVFKELTKTAPNTWTGKLLLLGGTGQKMDFHDCRLNLSNSGQSINVFCKDRSQQNFSMSRKYN